MVAEILHAGHVKFFEHAVREGHKLGAGEVDIVVGLLSDEDAADAKRWPACTLMDRGLVMKRCDLVDEVLVNVPRLLTMEFMKKHRLDYVVHGSDWSPLLDWAYKEIVDAGQMLKVPYSEGISTTEILDFGAAHWDERHWREGFVGNCNRSIENRFAKWLPMMFPHQETVYGVELGVHAGRHAAEMLARLSSLRLIGVDMWEKHTTGDMPSDYAVQDIPMNRKFLDREHGEHIRRLAENRLGTFKGRVQLSAQDTVQAAKVKNDRFFDFVYIDADHSYEAVKKDLAAWYPKVKNDGYLAGHGWDWQKSGVRQAVEEFMLNKSFELITSTKPAHEWIIGPIYR